MKCICYNCCPPIVVGGRFQSRNEIGIWPFSPLLPRGVAPFVKALKDWTVFDFVLWNKRKSRLAGRPFTTFLPAWVRESAQSRNGNVFHNNRRDINTKHSVVNNDFQSTRSWIMYQHHSPRPGFVLIFRPWVHDPKTGQIRYPKHGKVFPLWVRK